MISSNVLHLYLGKICKKTALLMFSVKSADGLLLGVKARAWCVSVRRYSHQRVDHILEQYRVLRMSVDALNRSIERAAENQSMRDAIEQREAEWERSYRRQEQDVRTSRLVEKNLLEQLEEYKSYVNFHSAQLIER